MSTVQRSTSAASTQKETADIAVRNLGIISQRVFYWYRFLPQNIRSGYDPEDMISDVVTHVVRRCEKYNSKLARESTWVWRVVDRYCLELVQHFNRKMFTDCENVSMEEPACSKMATPSFERQFSAFNAVERVIEFGSDSVLDIIETLLSGRMKSNGKTKDPPLEALQEFRTVARRCSASIEDFQLVLQYASQ